MMDGNGTLKIVAAPSGGETHHALDRDGPKDCWRTACGRDASGWLEAGTLNIARFLDSAYSCKQCARAVLE